MEPQTKIKIKIKETKMGDGGYSRLHERIYKDEVCYSSVSECMGKRGKGKVVYLKLLA